MFEKLSLISILRRKKKNKKGQQNRGNSEKKNV